MRIITLLLTLLLLASTAQAQSVYEQFKTGSFEIDEGYQQQYYTEWTFDIEQFRVEPRRGPWWPSVHIDVYVSTNRVYTYLIFNCYEQDSDDMSKTIGLTYSDTQFTTLRTIAKGERCKVWVIFRGGPSEPAHEPITGAYRLMVTSPMNLTLEQGAHGPQY